MSTGKRIFLFAAMFMLLFGSLSVADDHFEWLPEDTFIAVTLHDADEFRAFWNLPEIQKMLELGSEEIQYEMGMQKLNAVSKLFLDATIEEVLNDVDGAITFAVTGIDIATAKVSPLFIVNMKPESGRINQIIEKLKSAATLEDDSQKQISHRVIGMRDVFSFEEEISMTRVENSLVFYHPASADEIYQIPANNLAGNPAFQEHIDLVNIGSGISFYMNVEYAMNKILAAQEANPEAAPDVMTLLLEMFDIYSVKSVSTRFPLSNEDDWRVFIKAPGYGGILTDIFKNSPVVNEYFGSIHPDYDAAMGISIHNGKKIFESIVARIVQLSGEDDSSLRERLAEFKAETGVDLLDDILAQIDYQLGLAIRFNEDASGVSAYNPFSLLQAFNYEIQFGVVDQPRLANAIQAIIDSEESNIPVIRVDHGDGIIWGQDPEQAFSPVNFAVGLKNNQLYLALTSIEGMKAAFDRISAGDTMLRNAETAETVAAIPVDSMSASAAKALYFAKYASITGKINLLGGEMPETYSAMINDVIAEIRREARPMFGFYRVQNGGLFGAGVFPVRSMMKLFLIEVIKLKAMMEAREETVGSPGEQVM